MAVQVSINDRECANLGEGCAGVWSSGIRCRLHCSGTETTAVDAGVQSEDPAGRWRTSCRHGSEGVTFESAEVRQVVIAMVGPCGSPVCRVGRARARGDFRPAADVLGGSGPVTAHTSVAKARRNFRPLEPGGLGGWQSRDVRTR